MPQARELNKFYTKQQLFFIHYENERSRGVIENHMGFEALSKENLVIPGFGKTDFVRSYLETLKMLDTI